MFPKSVWTAAAALAAALLCVSAVAQSAESVNPAGPARPANNHEWYKALRGVLPAGLSFPVKNWTLEREGAKIEFIDGAFTLYAPVNGRITGAVFIGKGHFSMTPADRSERRTLAFLTKGDAMSQDFDGMVLRFTDATADVIRTSSPGAAGPDSRAAVMAMSLSKSFRKEIHENLELRLLEDVLGPRDGGFFLASFHMGGTLTGRNVLFIVDPQGAPHASPDEVELSTWSSDLGVETWAASRMAGAGAEGRGIPLHIKDQVLDVSFESNGKMQNSALTTLSVAQENLRVVRLNLYPTLRVTGVFAENGTPLDFVQEGKLDDPQFAVLLPQTAKRGDTVRLLTKYGGPDAVRHDGTGVYYLEPGARETWYPSGQEQLGGYSQFHMTFHLPKTLSIVATGKQVNVEKEGSGTRAVWETDTPIPVAGFNLGIFKTATAKTPAGFQINAYANEEMPDAYAQFSSAVLGGLGTTGALNSEISQGNAAIQIYTNYFGKLPYDHVALTQQSACNFGQSWPMLVYLPTCAFWDSTVKFQLGLLQHDPGYWNEVTPHEVSHQWWGQLVGFNSYRDQWMSEGFANYSAGLYLQHTSNKMDEYRKFWADQRKNLLQKNENGKRPVDVGPLTMGYRVNNDKTGGFVAQMLLYSKGAYILHMLEAICGGPQPKNPVFYQKMQEFVKQYAGKAATTEDFKHSLEADLPKSLDLDGNGKLDWFFDEWVYGTAVPRYTIESDFKVDGEVTTMHFKVQQLDVPESFRMIVPFYLQLEKGEITRLGEARLFGTKPLEGTIRMSKLPSPAKKILLNVNSDILSD